MALLLDRIGIDPAVCCDTPRIRGRRIRVSLLLDRMVAGESADNLLGASAFGAEAVRGRVLPTTIERAIA